MVKFTAEELHKTMGRINNIRSIYVAAHVDHDSSMLTDSLVAAAGIISQEVAGDVRMTDISADEAEQGVTIEPAGISLYCEMSDKSLRYYKGERDGNGFLINLINDSPGHVEVSPEAMCALHMTDVFCSPKVFRQPQYKKASSDTVTNGKEFASPPNLKDKENVPLLQLRNTLDLVKKDGVDREEEGPKAKGSTGQRSTKNNMVSSGSRTDKKEYCTKIQVPKHIV